MSRKMAVLVSIGVSLVLAMTTIVRADLKDYIDSQTLVAAEADLTKVDPAALEPWLRQMMTAAGMTGTGDHALKADDVDHAMSEMKRWLSDVVKAGGKHIYLVTQFDMIRNSGMGPLGGMAIIIPAEAGGDANKLAALLNSGRAEGPTSRPVLAMRGQDMSKYIPRSEVINGNIAVFGTPAALKYVQSIKPADRPDVSEALSAIGDSPIKIVIAPTLSIRNLMMAGLPQKVFDQPSTTVTQDLKWAVIGINAPPTVSAKAIGQSSSAASAQALNHIVTYGLASLSGVPPTMSPDMAKMLTPTVSNDQLVATFDNDKLTAMAKEMAPIFAQQRKQAMMVQGMSNERQLLMGCMMYSNENKGKWPDDLQAIKKFVPNVEQILINPNHPDLKPGYVYIKPSSMKNANQTLVIYESHHEFGHGVAVGFADGHCEMIGDKAMFDAMVAKTAMDEPPQ